MLKLTGMDVAMQCGLRDRSSFAKELPFSSFAVDASPVGKSVLKVGKHFEITLPGDPSNPYTAAWLALTLPPLVQWLPSVPM